MTPKKKLIEVALPLDAINAASAREKSIRHGHPSTLHLWWARRPLAAARAVIFAQMVDDPSSHPERFPTEEAQEKERQRLFRIIEQLVGLLRAHSERFGSQSCRYRCFRNRRIGRNKADFIDMDMRIALQCRFQLLGELYRLGCRTCGETSNEARQALLCDLR